VEMLHVAQPEIVKDMCHWTPLERGKPHYLMKSFKPPFGEGMMTANDGLSTWCDRANCGCNNSTVTSMG